jgi:hypothetical protein
MWEADLMERHTPDFKWHGEVPAQVPVVSYCVWLTFTPSMLWWFGCPTSRPKLLAML